MYILETILRFFSSFVINNMELQHYRLILKPENKFSLLEIFAENQTLKMILEIFRKLIKIYKKHPQMACSVFSHKLFVKEKIKGYKFIDNIIYGIKYVKKYRKRSGSILGNNLLRELYYYIRDRKSEIENFHKYSSNNINTMVQLLWG